MSIGGADGVNVDVGLGTAGINPGGGGTIGSGGTGVGGTGLGGTVGGTNGGLAATTGRNNSAIGRTVAGLSGKELARYKRRCAEVLANSSDYDNDLVSLCNAVRGMR